MSIFRIKTNWNELKRTISALHLDSDQVSSECEKENESTRCDADDNKSSKDRIKHYRSSRSKSFIHSDGSTPYYNSSDDNLKRALVSNDIKSNKLSIYNEMISKHQNAKFVDASTKNHLSKEIPGKTLIKRYDTIKQVNDLALRHQKCPAKGEADEEFVFCLQNAETRNGFKDFSTENCCAESIEFWVDVESFKTLTNPEAMKREAERMFCLYVEKNSRKEINVDFKISDKLRKSYQEPTPCLFNEAQTAIFRLMKNNTFILFKNTDNYRRLKARVLANNDQPNEVIGSNGFPPCPPKKSKSVSLVSRLFKFRPKFKKQVFFVDKTVKFVNPQFTESDNYNQKAVKKDECVISYDGKTYTKIIKAEANLMSLLSSIPHLPPFHVLEVFIPPFFESISMNASASSMKTTYLVIKKYSTFKLNIGSQSHIIRAPWEEIIGNLIHSYMKLMDLTLKDHCKKIENDKGEIVSLDDECGMYDQETINVTLINEDSN